jgi:hypothetical protein
MPGASRFNVVAAIAKLLETNADRNRRVEAQVAGIFGIRPPAIEPNKPGRPAQLRPKRGKARRVARR